MSEERLAALEFRVAYQEESLQALSDELAKQQNEIRLCQQKIQLLVEEVLRLRESDSGASAQDVAPPHY